MKELSRFELAIVKRTAQNTKTLRTKRDKLIAKIEESQAELEKVVSAIEGFEAPIRELTGGFSSEEVLNGTMEVAAATEEAPEGEVDETATTEEKEVPAEEAVTIDPNVQSPLEGETPWGSEGCGECGTDTTAAPFCEEENVKQD